MITSYRVGWVSIIIGAFFVLFGILIYLSDPQLDSFLFNFTLLALGLGVLQKGRQILATRETKAIVGHSAWSCLLMGLILLVFPSIQIYIWYVLRKPDDFPIYTVCLFSSIGMYVLIQAVAFIISQKIPLRLL